MSFFIDLKAAPRLVRGGVWPERRMQIACQARSSMSH